MAQRLSADGALVAPRRRVDAVLPLDVHVELRLEDEAHGADAALVRIFARVQELNLQNAGPAELVPAQVTKTDHIMPTLTSVLMTQKSNLTAAGCVLEFNNMIQTEYKISIISLYFFIPLAVFSHLYIGPVHWWYFLSAM